MWGVPKIRGTFKGDIAQGLGFRVWGLGFPKIRATFFGGPHIRDYSVLGSILGSPYFGKLPCVLLLKWTFLENGSSKAPQRVLRWLSFEKP